MRQAEVLFDLKNLIFQFFFSETRLHVDQHYLRLKFEKYEKTLPASSPDRGLPALWDIDI
jgi:hypothetical protein